MWCLTSVYLGLGIRTRLIWLVVAGARGRPGEGGRGTRASRSGSSSHPTQKSRPAQQQAARPAAGKKSKQGSAEGEARSSGHDSLGRKKRHVWGRHGQRDALVYVTPTCLPGKYRRAAAGRCVRGDGNGTGCQECLTARIKKRSKEGASGYSTARLPFVVCFSSPFPLPRFPCKPIQSMAL
jgi:hypothetical protein